MSFTDNIKQITPSFSEIKNNTPVIVVNGKVLVNGIGGNFIPAGQGGSSMNFYKCASVGTGTWTGYKAVLTDGVYSFEPALTSDLTYGSGLTPEVGKIYDNGALVEVADLWDGIPQAGLIRYAPMSTSAASDDLGNNLSTDGTPTFEVDSGISCAAMDSSSYIGYSSGITDLTAYTLSIWIKKPSSEGSAFMTFSGGNFGYGGDELWLQYWANGHIELTNGSGGSDYLIVGTQNIFSGWRHICFAWTGTVFRLYVDGLQQGSDTATQYSSQYSSLYAYINSLKRATSVRGDGKYAAFRLYNRVLSATEISALANEFTPTAS